MAATFERLAARQHLAAALLSAWLILTSPWIAMLRAMPRGAGLLDYSHVALGFAALFIAITYTISCTRAGGWRLYFPWAAGQFQSVARDIGGLLRGRIPASESGGLFGAIEGVGDRKSNRMSTSMAHVWGVSGMHTGDCWVDFSKPVARDFSV